MCERKVWNYFEEKPIVFEPQEMQRMSAFMPTGTDTPFRKLRSCNAFTSTIEPFICAITAPSALFLFRQFGMYIYMYL